MARLLVCIDALPLEDGTCQQTAWIELPSMADYLPTFEEGNEVGVMFFSTLVIASAVKHFFKPPR